VPEMNNGQLVALLRAAYLLPAERFSQVNGKPFKVSTVLEAIRERTAGSGKGGAA
jgi:2-oxoglutarate ferredoxin oxidoreductase subunit alpha